MGLAQSAYGAGLILGALVAPISSKRLPPLADIRHVRIRDSNASISP